MVCRSKSETCCKPARERLILKRTEFEEKTLEYGDKVKFLYFMGGGNDTD